MKRAVFLDRDGVINRSFVRDGRPYPPASLEQVEILPCVAEALAMLRQAGYLNVVVTNQPDVRTGAQQRDIVESIHRYLVHALPLDDVRVCYHIDEDDCKCRKPLPGMLLQAAVQHNIDLGASFMVGDRWRDVRAGQAAGCRSFFIDAGYHEQRPEPPFTQVASLIEAVHAIVQEAPCQPLGSNHR